MSKHVREHVFRVNSIAADIQQKYRAQLGWFFDDFPNNPLIYPSGLFHVDADDQAQTLRIEYAPDDTSLEDIQRYLASLGIDTTPLHEHKTSLKEVLLGVLLFIIFSPFLLVFVIFEWHQKRRVK